MGQLSTLVILVQLMSFGVSVPCYGDVKCELREMLSRSYNPLDRPVNNTNDAIMLNATLAHSYSRLIDNCQTLSLRLSVTIEWYDTFLVWNPDHYQGINNLHFSLSQIWKPKLSIHQSLEIQNIIQDQDDDCDVKVLSNGRVTLQVKSIIKTPCSFNASIDYINDKVCQFDITNTYYSEDEAKFQDVDFHPYDEHDSMTPWRLKNATHTIGTILGKSVIILKFALLHKPFYYTLKLIVPLFCTTIINPMVFLLQNPTGVSLTILLSYSVFINSVGDLLPNPTSLYSPLEVYIMAIYVESCLIAVFCIILELTEVFYIWNSNNSKWNTNCLGFIFKGILMVICDKDKIQTDKDKSQTDKDKSQTDKDKSQTDKDTIQTDKDKSQTDKDKSQTDKDEIKELKSCCITICLFSFFMAIALLQAGVILLCESSNSPVISYFLFMAGLLFVFETVFRLFGTYITCCTKHGSDIKRSIPQQTTYGTSQK